MHSSPLKYLTPFTATTRNVGVEAKDVTGDPDFVKQENEFGDTLNLNLESSVCNFSRNVSCRTNIKDDNETNATLNSGSLTEDSGSYIHVIVKKHHNKRTGNGESLQQPEVPQLKVENNVPSTSPKNASSPKNDANKTQILQGDNMANIQNLIQSLAEQTNSNFYILPALFSTTQPLILPRSHPTVQPMVKSDDKKNCKTAKSIKNIENDQEKIINNSRNSAGLKGNLNNSSNKMKIKRKILEAKCQEKMEIYCFEDCNMEFLQTTDSAPITIGDGYIFHAETIATKFWAEFFSFPYLVMTFITSFIIQFQRFVLIALFRPLVVDTLQTCSDYGLKPLMALIHNAIIRPPFLFLQHVMNIIQKTVRPLTRMFSDLLNPVNHLIASFRPVIISKKIEAKSAV